MPKVHKNWVELVGFLIVRRCLEDYVKLVPVMCSVHGIMALVKKKALCKTCPSDMLSA